MLNLKMLPLSIQSKWEKEVHMGVVIEDYNWSFIYCYFKIIKTLLIVPWAELCSVKPRIMSFALKGKLRPHIFRKLPIDNQKFRT
jgi:hypothetical protein